jgi:trehalose 6-phosphate phosphatase
MADPLGAGVFTDFDGTLAAIVDDPASSRPLPGAAEVLASLAHRVGRVAVISGRPVSVLGRFFGPSVTLSGLYGLQRLVDGRREDHPDALAWAPVVDDVVARATAEGPDGMRVEHKELSVTLHYRERPDVASAVEAWAVEASERTGLERHSARMSVELHPPVAADKGTALVDLSAGLSSVCFIGDDVGDLPAFAALDHLATTGVTTVKVAVASAEQDPRLAQAADLVVPGPEAVVDLLHQLLTALPPPR